jgi:hypothetical protein
VVSHFAFMNSSGVPTGRSETAMTAMRDRLSYDEDTETAYEFELPGQFNAAQLDDEDFEPTIVRGRE